MLTFIKPSGVEIQVNETSAQHAQDMGWKLKVDREKTEQAEAPKRRGRPKKSEG